MRRTLAALSAALLAGGLAACGSSGVQPPSNKADPTTSTTASAARQARTGQALFASMTAAMADAETATVTFSSAVAQQRVTGTGSFRLRDADLAANIKITLPGQGRVQVILLPEAFYLKLPASAGLPAGRPWLEVSDGGEGDIAGKAFGPLLDQLRQTFDPESNVGILTASTALMVSGKESVGGVETTKYTATVDLATAAEAAAGSLAQQYRTLVQRGVTTLTYQLWVDGDQLPRRFSTVVPTPQGDVRATGTYRGWGQPVTITAPPAGQVTSGTSLSGADLGG